VATKKINGGDGLEKMLVLCKKTALKIVNRGGGNFLSPR